MTWQPIETAPKDGTQILAHGMGVKGMPKIAWDANEPREPAWLVIRWVEAWYDDYEDQGDGTYKKVQKQGYAYWQPDPQQFQPTHWMPLPPPATP